MSERDFKGTDRFSVERMIGQGGMGVVYEAVDLARGARVALKTLNRFDAVAIYRMKQEFRALADVSHPNLVQLHELVSSGDRWFITMELVDGVDFLAHVRAVPPDEDETLGARRTPAPAAPAPEGSDWFAPADVRLAFSTLDGSELEPAAPGRLLASPPPRAAEGRPAPRPIGPAAIGRLRAAMVQLADGIIALHDAGKLHRDIKPSNVLVNRAGRVVLLDFGLVTELYEEWLIKSTMEGVVVGTVAYMAPEQSAGLPLGPASDWYAVGVMLFEALTGQLPFSGRLYEVLLDKQRKDALRASELAPEVPPDLELLAAELLRREPSERPTGREVRARLLPGGSAGERSSRTWQVPSQLSTFVGRDRQLAMLDDALRTAQAGTPVIVHVYGRPGTGKSALVRHFLDELSNDERHVVLAGRCYERELVPYKAFDSVIDTLSRFLRKLPEEEAVELMGPDVRALARIFPALARVEAMQHAPVGSLFIPDPAELRRRAFAALRDLLLRIGQRRTPIIFIDDLQWGDEDSAALLGDLMRPPRPPPLLLVTCHRSEDRNASPMIRALASSLPSFFEVDVREIQLGPLELREATRLARVLLAERDRGGGSLDTAGAGDRPPRAPDGAATRAEAIARESGGNPLFVYELAMFEGAELASTKVQRPPSGSAPLAPVPRVEIGMEVTEPVGPHGEEDTLAVPGGPEAIVAALRAETARRARLAASPPVPPAGASGDTAEREVPLARALEARFHALPPEALRLLQVIAIAARPLEVELAHRAAGLAPDDRAASSLLKGARLVRSRTPRLVECLETYHNRIGAAVLAELSPARVAELHLAIARALEASRDPDPELLVVHLAAGGDAKRAAEHAITAAARAMAALAFDRAASLYRTAIELAPASPEAEWSLRQKLAEALGDAGRGQEAAEVYLEAAKQAPRSAAFELERRAAEQLLQSGYVDRGVRVMRQVLAAVGVSYPDNARSALRMLNLQRLQLHLRGFRPRAPAAPAPKEILASIDACWTATTGLAMVDAIHSAYFHSRQLRLALDAGEPYRLVRALAAEVCLVGGVDRKRERTARVLAQLRAVAAQLDDPHVHGLVELATGFMAFFRGLWSEAITHTERALQIFSERCTGVAWELDTARIVLFSALAYRGRLAELPARVHAELRQADLRKNLYASTILRTSPNVAKMWLALDEVQEARGALSAAMAGWSHTDFHVQHLHALLSETDFDLYQGEGQRAWSRIRRRFEAIHDSQLLRLRLFRVEAHFGRARSALAAAALGHETARLVQVALEDARQIQDAGAGMSWAASIAGLVRAEAAILRGDLKGADRLLAGAVEGFSGAGMDLHRAVALRRRGELGQGEEHRVMLAESERWMAAEGVVRPDRMARMLAPVARR